MKSNLIKWANKEKERLEKKNVKNIPIQTDLINLAISEIKSLGMPAKMAYIHMAMGSDSFSPSLQTLEKRLGTTRKTVIKAIRDLDGKYIYLSHCDIESRRNMYVLLPPDEWGSVDSLPDYYQCSISTGGSGVSPLEGSGVSPLEGSGVSPQQLIEETKSNKLIEKTNIRDTPPPKKKKTKTAKKSKRDKTKKPRLTKWEPNHKYAVLFDRMNSIEWWKKSFCVHKETENFDLFFDDAKKAGHILGISDALDLIRRWERYVIRKGYEGRPRKSFQSYIDNNVNFELKGKEPNNPPPVAPRPLLDASDIPTNSWIEQQKKKKLTKAELVIKSNS